MGFVRIFQKKNVQEAYLLKMSILGQLDSEIVAQLCLESSIQTLLNFFALTPKKYNSLDQNMFGILHWLLIRLQTITIC